MTVNAAAAVIAEKAMSREFFFEKMRTMTSKNQSNNHLAQRRGENLSIPA
jgi:hypothetical protein